MKKLVFGFLLGIVLTMVASSFTVSTDRSTTQGAQPLAKAAKPGAKYAAYIFPWQ